MVKVSEGPVQLTLLFINVGVTSIVAVTGEVLVLTTLKDAISPEPEAGKFILGVSLVHV
jgi:hypothetical protein